MGIVFSGRSGSYSVDDAVLAAEQFPVLEIASSALVGLFEKIESQKFGFLVTATSCPDRVAPSFGQEVASRFSERFSSSQVFELIQGCSGGTAALALGYQLAAFNKTSVVVLLADAARLAVSRNSYARDQFANAAFACVIEYREGVDSKLVHSMSRQYSDLVEVVQVPIGHSLREKLEKHDFSEIRKDPASILGLHFRNDLAIRLIRRARGFYEEFIRETGEKPDSLILHHVSPKVIRMLKETVFHDVNVIDLTDEVKNCGCASVGIVFNRSFESLKGKTTLICSFGTGGMISGCFLKL